MPDIRIKNIGPIVDTGVIELTAIMLIVGKQSSGKSTFMKWFFYWFYVGHVVLCGLIRVMM